MLIFFYFYIYFSEKRLKGFKGDKDRLCFKIRIIIKMNSLTIPIEQEFWINSKEETIRELKTLKKHNALITVFHDKIFCITAILEVTNNEVIIDIDPNVESRYLLLIKNEIYLSAKINGVPIFLELRDGKMDTYEGNLCWRFAIPNRVHKLQRRESFRVNFPVMIAAKVSLDEIQDLKIMDMSLSGVAILTKNIEALEIDKKLTLKMELPEYKDIVESELVIPVTIRHITKLPNTNDKYKVGLRFDRVTMYQESILHKWQIRLEQLMLLTKD